jgi:hypothetical protein
MSQPRDRIEQLDDDLPYQRREWRAQRFGWWALTVFVAAAALGVFGGGPLSRATAASADGGLRLDYDRFVRSGAPARMLVHVAGSPAPDPGRALHLEFSRDFIDAIGSSVSPRSPRPSSSAPTSSPCISRMRGRGTPPSCWISSRCARAG